MLKGDELDQHAENISVFYKPGHYDIIYSYETISKLEPEHRISLYIYDNDTYEIYRRISIAEEIVSKTIARTECCRRTCNKFIYKELCTTFKGESCDGDYTNSMSNMQP